MRGAAAHRFRQFGQSSPHSGARSISIACASFVPIRGARGVAGRLGAWRSERPSGGSTRLGRALEIDRPPYAVALRRRHGAALSSGVTAIAFVPAAVSLRV